MKEFVIEAEECHDFLITGCDTDSISFTKSNQAKFTEEEMNSLIGEINALLPEGIVYEDDGYFKSMLIVKAKNYALQSFNKKEPVKIKGSALKATMKEPALREFISLTIDLILNKKKDHLFNLYNHYAQEIMEPEINIERWSSKKTITHSVLNPERTTEQKIYDAIEGKGLSQGDKILVYFKEDDSIACIEDYNKDHSRSKLLGKLYKTITIFANIVDVDCFPNYSLSRNKELLND